MPVMAATVDSSAAAPYTDPADMDGDTLPVYDTPPSLDYSLAPRKYNILFFWSAIVVDSVVMPLALYFGLWYGTSLSPNAVFSIVTAALGGISIFEYVVRFWALYKKTSSCRVIGGSRRHLDWFHWCFTAMWFVVMIELIVGTIFKNPPIRLLSMPLTTVLFTFGTELLIIDAMRLLGIPNLFRISSLPQGAQQRPGIYSIIEDVVAVDGGGGTEYRRRFSARYEASHAFRQMLHRLTLFWATGAEATAILCTILIFTLDSGEAAYVIGWTVPFIFAGIWALGTWRYVKRYLRFERENWNRDLGNEPGMAATASEKRLARAVVHRPERENIRTSMSSRPRMSLDHGSRSRVSIDPGSRPRVPSAKIDRTRKSMDPDMRPVPQSLQAETTPFPPMPDRKGSARSMPETIDRTKSLPGAC